MIHLPASVRVYLCLSPCDMRKSFDSLHALVRDHLELDAYAGHLVVFASRRRDRIKSFVLGSRRFCNMGEAVGRRDVCDSCGRGATGTAARDYSAGVGRDTEWDRPPEVSAAQTVSAVHLEKTEDGDFVIGIE
jgi:hypothetical protein